MIVSKLVIVHKDYEMINCEFSSSDIDSSNIYKTLIIGQNASGKSFLLRQICDIFEMIEQYVNTGKIKRDNKRYDKYEISYLLGNDKYTVVINEQSKLRVLKNKEEVDITELSLPKKVIANTYLFDDKFKFSQNENDSLYYYGGTKTTSNAIFLSNSQLDLLRYITNYIKTPKQVILLEILQYLGYSSDLKINIKFKTIDLDKLIERRMNKKLVSNRVKKIDEFNKIEEVRELYNNKELVSIIIDLADTDNTLQILEKVKQIQVLEEIGAIKSIEIFLNKGLIEVPYEYCSSGEKQLLFTFMKIGTAVEENSIVLIDEPESSLHPSWQNKYIKDIEEIFLKLNIKIHFIISSHSAYMVSSLKEKNASLVTVKSFVNNERLHRVFEEIPYSTFAWSIESILYEVFEMRTARNFYVEQDLSILIEYLNGSLKDMNLLTKSLEKLRPIVLNENDPLVDLIQKVEKSLEGGRK